jgi:hypothetical protein
MKEFRGAEAVRYARENGIDFDVDWRYLAETEGEMRGEKTSIADVDRMIEDRLGRGLNLADVTGGGETFDFLVNRYGDGWIYVAVEGCDPEAEEAAALRMYRRLLEGSDPVPGSDVKSLLGRYGRPRLGDTGFQQGTALNLMFHAALRLAEKGLLESVADEDSPDAPRPSSYGRRRFLIPADVRVSFADALCEKCRREVGAARPGLHRECARRLRKVLAEAVRA